MKELTNNEMSSINGGKSSLLEKGVWLGALWGYYKTASEFDSFLNDVKSIPSKFKEGFNAGK